MKTDMTQPRICLLKSTYERLKESVITLLPGEICLVDTDGTGYDSLVVGDGKTQAKDLSMIPLNVTKGAVFLGIANKETNPGTPNQRVFYLSAESGTYDNLGGVKVEEGSIALIIWDTEEWKSLRLFKVDSELNEGSLNPVQNKIITKKLTDLENNVIKVVTINGVALERGEGGVINLIVDEAFSTTSKNPIMNKTVTNKINEFSWYEGN